MSLSRATGAVIAAMAAGAAAATLAYLYLTHWQLAVSTMAVSQQQSPTEVDTYAEFCTLLKFLSLLA